MLTKDSKFAADQSGAGHALKTAMLAGAKAGKSVTDVGMGMAASIADGITGTHTASQLHGKVKQIPDAFFAPFRNGGSHHR